jgi:hypothetical protein
MLATTRRYQQPAQEIAAHLRVAPVMPGTISRQKNNKIFYRDCSMRPIMPIMITPGTEPGHLTTLAMSVHNVIGKMPVAVKARDRPGVLVADGSVKQECYESDALDSVFAGKPVKTTVADGDYSGIPMYVSAIFDNGGHAVAAIGVIDTAGILSLQEFAEISDRLTCQSGKKRRPVK